MADLAQETTRLFLSLLDHFVGSREERFRHLDAQRLCRLQVDGEYELGRLLNRQVGRLGAVEDFADIDANLTVTSRKKNLRGFQIVNPTQKNQAGGVYFSML
jgi:hypothetical protein